MTPQAFLEHYSYDERLVTGEFYPSEPLQLEHGDTVGVVLFNLGGPRHPEEVEGFLYNLFMDPVIIDIPIPRVLRHRLCKLIARRRSKMVRQEYGLIGGASPINAHTERQAQLLEECLNADADIGSDIRFKVYTAMRYGTPSSEDVAYQMDDDSVKKVVLLPLYPQYSKTTTGASLVYWHALEQAGELQPRATTTIFEYAAHPSYIRAINARIDEALKRFGSSDQEIFLLFSAHGTPVKELKVRRDPYCCLIHSTVHRVMQARGRDRPFRVAFQSKVNPVEWLTPSTPQALEELAERGHTSVLVIPVAFVSDHLETVFELEIEVRHQAEQAGIKRFEVTEGLNDHPAFVEALADITLRHVDGGRNSSSSRPYGRFQPAERTTACHQCPRIKEAFRWESKRSQEPDLKTV